MKLVTLGAPRLDCPDAAPAATRRKQLALLSYLARQENREATRSQLADLLWEEGDRARARHSLRQALSGLRPVLGDLLVTDGQRVRLSPELSLDLADMERQAGAGGSAVTADGEFLAGFDDVGGERWRSWLARERDALRRRLRWRSGPSINRNRRAASRRDRREPTDALAEAWSNQEPGGVLIVDLLPDPARVASCERFASERANEGQLLAADAGAPLSRPHAYLSRLCARLPELRGLDDAPASALAALRRHAPALANRFPQLPLRSTSSRDLSGALSEVLAAAASAATVTVVATDLERADPASRAIIFQLVRERPSNVSFVMVGSLDDAALGADLRSLARLPGVTLVRREGAADDIVPAPAPQLPPVDTLASRFTRADRLLLAAGGAVALLALVLALLASI